MSPALLACLLAAAVGALAVVINQVQARLGLIEVTLNEGLPPGHERTDLAASTTPTLDPAQALGPGVHVFLSRSCHACQRLVDELRASPRIGQADLVLRFVDRPRPIAREFAASHGAALHEQQIELAAGVGADPLPFTVAVGPHDLVSRAVTPTRRSILDTARNAGMALSADVTS